MIDYLQSAFLGLIQGITELLPISSSSHLVFFGRLFSFTAVDEKLFALFIQTGSALALLLRLFPDIRKLASGVLHKETQACSMTLSLIMGMLPVCLIGVLFRSFIQEHFYSNDIVAYALMVGGALLILLDPISGQLAQTTLSWKRGLLIGLFQVFSVIPGVSRLGSTLIGGVFAGLSRAATIRFSFLMAIPLLLAAGALDLLKRYSTLESGMVSLLATGALMAFFVTYWLFPIIVQWLSEKGYFSLGWYRILFGFFLLFR